MSLDGSLLTAPRAPNGELPYIAFAQLVSRSDLVDAGTNAGFAFAGAAPDLGAFEYGLNPPPTLSLKLTDAQLIYSGNGGPANGTNYLVASTNLALPPEQWEPVATNRFGPAGGFSFSNALPPGTPQQLQRLRLP
jgi:hypothetical protein